MGHVGAPSPTLTTAAPFVGRAAPLRDLVAAIDGVASGGRLIALIAGEPGVGKTRLVTEP
jgi:predicted ATPase